MKKSKTYSWIGLCPIICVQIYYKNHKYTCNEKRKKNVIVKKKFKYVGNSYMFVRFGSVSTIRILN